MAEQEDPQKFLPPALRHRFGSLGSFVSAVIREKEERGAVPKRRRLALEEKQDIALLVFVASLRRFLQEGAHAASAAAEEAVSLGLAGFKVGNYEFAPGNENTRRGAVLADSLWARIDDNSLRNLLDSELSLTKLVEELYSIARDPKRLDRYITPPR
jgi:hypothetical protein